MWKCSAINFSHQGNWGRLTYLNFWGLNYRLPTAWLRGVYASYYGEAMIAEMGSYILFQLLIQEFCIEKTVICIFSFWIAYQSVEVCKTGRLRWRIMGTIRCVGCTFFVGWALSPQTCILSPTRSDPTSTLPYTTKLHCAYLFVLANFIRFRFARWLNTSALR